jgi:hypothetical protein
LDRQDAGRTEKGFETTTKRHDASLVAEERESLVHDDRPRFRGDLYEASERRDVAPDIVEKGAAHLSRCAGDL